GSFSVVVTVTDALSQVTSQTLSMTSQKDPSVTASGPSATDVGISTGWSGTVSYGATPYTYSWTINGGSVGTAASLSYTFSTAASYTLNLTVTDAQGTKGYWQETVVVSAQPSVSASASASAADVGISVTFTSTITAGTAPFTYIWLAGGTQVGPPPPSRGR
ncbi:PKD domain protein, partial [mine drainage metagenome]